MEKDVMIFINGMQISDIGGNEEPVEVIAPGKYYLKNGNHYLLFDDVDENLLDVNRNMIKFNDSYLEVNKKGSLNTQMVFEENKKTKAMYGTPFGTLNIGISTTSIDLNESEDKIELKANYALEVNDDFIADCCISLTARPKNLVTSILS